MMFVANGPNVLLLLPPQISFLALPDIPLFSPIFLLS
jgi:hypothetical protein